MRSPSGPVVRSVGRERSREPGSVGRALTTGFNVVCLNFVIVIVACGIATAPLALVAGQKAIYNWRVRGEDRLVREFRRALLDRPLRTSAAAAPSMVVTALGVLEVQHFSGSVSTPGAVSFAVGVLTAAVGFSLTAYVSLFLAVGPREPLVALWRRAFTAVGRMPVATAGLSLEALLGCLLGYVDPALVVGLVPVAVVLAWYRTARWGAIRCGVASVS